MSKTNGNKNLIKYDIDQRPMEKTYKFRFSYSGKNQTEVWRLPLATYIGTKFQYINLTEYEII